MKTEQEQFWEGDFGNQYHKRNTMLTKNNVDFFANIFWKGKAPYPLSLIEFGAGTGNNLVALREMAHGCRFTAVEINPVAVAALEVLRRDGMIQYVIDLPISDLDPKLMVGHSAMAMTKGLLIHIPPADLPKAYAVLYGAAQRWVLICEYYNPTPVEVPYRGHAGKLWKRDFAGELLDAYADLKLVDYGFRYHRDQYPQDDVSWFLLEKQNG